VCKTVFVDLGFPAENVRICGHPHFDVVRKKRLDLTQTNRIELRQRVFPNAPTEKPIWLFLAEGIDLLNPALSFRSSEYTLIGRQNTDFRACIVLEELLDVSSRMYPQPWLALRPHPKSDLTDFTSVIPELGAIQRGGDPLEAVWAADMVIGMTTMLLLETALLQRPHFSILPRESESSWLATLGLGITRYAVTQKEIHDLALNPDPDFSRLEELLPSGAGARVVQLISEILSKKI
jgi:hypothetical protein